MPKTVRLSQLRALACAVLAAWAASAGMAAPALALPDGRQYELVSPPDKQGADVTPEATRAQAAVGGNAVTYASLGAFADARGTGVAIEYMAERDGRPGTQGWSTHAITPMQDPLTVFALTGFVEPQYVGEFAPDLSSAVFRAWSPLTDAPDVADVENLYVRQDLDVPGKGVFDLVTGCPGCGGTPLTWTGNHSEIPFPAGASADLRHVLFESTQNLTGNGSGNVKLYAADDGVVRLVGLVPPGSATSCGGGGVACVLPSGLSSGSIAGLGVSHLRYAPRVISADGTRVIFSGSVTTDGSVVTGSSPGNRSKLYERDTHGTVDTADDTTIRLNVTERTSPVTAQAALYQTASTDGTRVFFTSTEALTDDAPTGVAHLYMWDAHHLNDEEQRVTVSADAGTFALTFNGKTTTALPFDVSASALARALNALTTISGIGGSVEVTGGPGDSTGAAPYLVTFGGALAGTDVPLIAADGGLLTGGTSSATVTPWVAGGGHLTLLDRDNEPGDAPGGVQGVIGASDDGHYVYFVATGQLVSRQRLLGPTSARGIYLWHDGALRFIGSFSAASGDWVRDMPGGSGSGLLWNLAPLDSRVTPDGRHLLFRATDGDGLTRYDHSTTGCGVGGGSACAEYYVYSADSDSLVCATCNPTGAPATADADISVGTNSGAMNPSSHLSHALTDDGRRVFFTTAEPLVPEDTNGKRDAYVFDVASGRVALLSSGSSTADAYFIDASANGNDAFFLTRERLVGWDRDSALDLYDARVGGGVPDPVGAPPLCSGSPCQGVLAGAPATKPASSATFAGSGNVKNRLKPRSRKKRHPRCKRGHVRLKLHGRVRCVTRAKARRVKAKRRRAKRARVHARERGARKRMASR